VGEIIPYTYGPLPGSGKILHIWNRLPFHDCIKESDSVNARKPQSDFCQDRRCNWPHINAKYIVDGAFAHSELAKDHCRQPERITLVI